MDTSTTPPMKAMPSDTLTPELSSAPMASHHNGSLYKWASTLQYFVQQTIIDLGYAAMRLSGYMAVPDKPIFDALD
eukprot:5227477-Ditylum_brightwellii.AAC.1